MPYLRMWRDVWVYFCKIAIVSFLSVRYKSDGLYCRMARTPSSPTLFSTPSVRKYLSSKWIKRYVSKTKIRLDTFPFIHFDDKYFRTEGVFVFLEISTSDYDRTLPTYSKKQSIILMLPSFLGGAVPSGYLINKSRTNLTPS